jgi:hypothetical protein
MLGLEISLRDKRRKKNCTVNVQSAVNKNLMPAHLVIPDDKTHREDGNRKTWFFTNKALMRHLLFIGQSDKHECYRGVPITQTKELTKSLKFLYLNQVIGRSPTGLPDHLDQNTR